MRANVYKPYTLLSACVEAVYSLFSKRGSSNDLHGRGGIRTHGTLSRTHTFQARLSNRLNEHRRSISALTDTLVRSLRSETRPKTPSSRIQTVYTAPFRARELHGRFPLSEQGARDLERAVREDLKNSLKRDHLAWETQVWN